MNHKGQLRVMIMAGGTGGHVFPALAVVRELRKENALISWLGTRSGIESDIVPKHDIPLHFITVEGVRGRGLWALLKAPILVLRSISQALSILGKIQPQVVVGMGGFASGPGAMAAWLRRIPVIIHEQNSIAGTTNKICALFAKRILEGFPNTLPRGEWCGNPVRHEIIKLAPPEQRFQGRNGKLKLLVLGGSRGALTLNTVLPKLLRLLGPKLRPEILHQTGSDHWEFTQELYISEDIDLRDSSITLVPFIDKMEEAYGWADLVICRAGALTISEITAVGLGALLIPFPFAIDDHQTSNAQVLVDKDAAELIQQSELILDTLASSLTELSSSKTRRLEMAKNARSLAKFGATQHVARACWEVVYG